MTILRRGLNRLRDHKFKHNFLDTINLICRGGADIEMASQFFLHYLVFVLFFFVFLGFFLKERTNPPKQISQIDSGSNM